jgi:hypothetical protein
MRRFVGVEGTICIVKDTTLEKSDSTEPAAANDAVILIVCDPTVIAGSLAVQVTFGRGVTGATDVTHVFVVSTGPPTVAASR